MLGPVRGEERGAAMVTALLVTFVVLLLSIFVVNLSIHSVGTSSYDRNRVLSISAAEAGVNDLWSVLRASAPAALPCTSGTPELTGTLDTFPGRSTYAVYVTYYDRAGGAFPLCADPGSGEALSTEPAPSQDHPPTAAKITSIGTTDGGVARKVESYVRLTPVIGSGSNAAIIADNGLVMSNNSDLAAATGHTADIYVNNGDICVSGNEDINGSIYVSQGRAYINTNRTIAGEVWAKYEVGLAQGTVTGYVKSSTGAVTVNKADCRGQVQTGGGGTVAGGEAWAKTYIDSKIKPTSLIRHVGQALGDPYSYPFPRYCWSPAEIGATVGDPDNPPCESTRGGWVDPPLSDPVTYPYTVHDFTGATACANAKAWLLGGTIGDGVTQTGFPSIPDPGPEAERANAVVRIDGSCQLLFDDPGVQTVTFNGNLAIYMAASTAPINASIWLKNQTNWKSVGGSHDVHFIVGYQPPMVEGGLLLSPLQIQQRGLCGATPSQSGGPGPYDVQFGNSTQFGAPYVSGSSPVAVTVYSPCRAVLFNQNNFTGQVRGGTVLNQGNFALTYEPVIVPGASDIGGFRVQVIYLREVA
jgi:hypothetical protein